MEISWNDVYSSGRELNKYPSEVLVSWIFNNRVQKHSRVLDVGCGNCNNLRFLLAEEFDAYGIDNSSYVVDLNKKEFPGRVSRQSINQTNFESCSFDLIVDRQAIQHNSATDLPGIFIECARILKKDGLMFSNFLLTHGNGARLANVREKDLDKIVKQNFDIVEKNWMIQTSQNSEVQHYSIIYTLRK